MTEPPRLPTAERLASQALIDAYAASWQRIDDAQRALVDDPLNARKQARLNELADMVSREIDSLDESAKAYVRDVFPDVYVGAAERAARAVAPDALAFVQPDREAAARLATGLYTELLEATSHVDATTKQLIRAIGRDAALRTAIEGKTAKQAATEMRRLLEERGIHAVRYSNGARVGLKAYAEMAIRTTTALAMNEGTLQGSVDAGCRYWEIFDGPTCGWTYHDDPEIANGKIVSHDDALSYPISHPNCRRAVSPRPDLGVDNVRDARRSTTPEQDAAQVEADVAAGRPVLKELAARAERAAGRRSVPRAPRPRPQTPESRVQAAMTRREFPSARKGAAEERHTVPPPEHENFTVRPGIRAPLNAAEKKAINDYAWGQDDHGGLIYVGINRNLRAGRQLTARQQQVVDQLDSAMAKSPAPRDMRVYRLVTDDEELANRLREAARTRGTFRDDGFMSTTTDQNILDDFDVGDHSVVMRVKVPEGHPAIDMSKNVDLESGVAFDQSEFLLPRGSTIRFTRLSRDAEGRDVVEGELQLEGRRAAAAPARSAPQVRAPAKPTIEVPYALRGVEKISRIDRDGTVVFKDGSKLTPRGVQLSPKGAAKPRGTAGAKEAAELGQKWKKWQDLQKPTTEFATTPRAAAVQQRVDSAAARAGAQATTSASRVTGGTAAQAKKVEATLERHRTELKVGARTDRVRVSLGDQKHVLEGVDPSQVPVSGTVEARYKAGQVRMYNRVMSQHDHDHLVESNWFSKREGDPLQSILTHELGHHLDHALSPPQRVRLFQEISDAIGVSPPKFPGDIEAWTQRNAGLIRRNVSSYGSTNSRELIAELWAEFGTAGEVRPVADRAGRLIQQLLRGQSPAAPTPLRTAPARSAPVVRTENLTLEQRRAAGRERIRLAEERARARRLQQSAGLRRI